VTELGLPYRFEVLGRHKRSSRSSDRGLLDTPAPVPLLELTCCHFAGRQPFCYEERLINLLAVPEAAQEAFSEMAPGAWLLGRVPWTIAEHKIRAAAADAATAAALQLRAGTPCLEIERRTWSADQPVTFVRLSYPGNLHELVASFAPPEPPASQRRR